MRFRHVRNEKGDPIATIASEPLNEDVVVFSLARCNLKVDTFHKKHGRKIAQDRIEKSYRIRKNPTTNKSEQPFKPFSVLLAEYDWHEGWDEAYALQYLLYGRTIKIYRDAIPGLIKALKLALNDPRERHAVLNVSGGPIGPKLRTKRA